MLTSDAEIFNILPSIKMHMRRKVKNECQASAKLLTLNLISLTLKYPGRLSGYEYFQMKLPGGVKMHF